MPITIGEWACREVLAKLDSYLDDELLTETVIEISRHVEACPACAREVAARRALRSRLRSAARQVDLPPGLKSRLRRCLRWSNPTIGAPWLMTIAAAVVAACGVPRGAL